MGELTCVRVEVMSGKWEPAAGRVRGGAESTVRGEAGEGRGQALAGRLAGSESGRDSSHGGCGGNKDLQATPGSNVCLNLPSLV